MQVRRSTADLLPFGVSFDDESGSERFPSDHSFIPTRLMNSPTTTPVRTQEPSNPLRMGSTFLRVGTVGGAGDCGRAELSSAARASAGESASSGRQRAGDLSSSWSTGAAVTVHRVRWSSTTLSVAGAPVANSAHCAIIVRRRANRSDRA